MLDRPWMKALDHKLSALRTLRNTFGRIEIAPRSVQMDALVLETYRTDMDTLEAADTFAWFDPALSAVLQASQSIPHDVKMEDLSLPKIKDGWWWFQKNLPFQTLTEQNTGISAILWTFRQEKSGRYYVGFSGYTQKDDQWSNVLGDVLPTASFRWFADETLHNMVMRLTLEYRRNYGPGGRYSAREGEFNGEKATITAATEMAMFFAAGLAWLNQTILTTSDGAVERHARKRIQKEFKVSEVPPVRVIALRHTHNPDSKRTAEENQKAREYHYWWTVSGHWKNQPFGPGRMGRKLIYILPHPAGDQSLPFKGKQEKLNVVLR